MRKLKKFLFCQLQALILMRMFSWCLFPHLCDRSNLISCKCRRPIQLWRNTTDKYTSWKHGATISADRKTGTKEKKLIENNLFGEESTPDDALLMWFFPSSPQWFFYMSQRASQQSSGQKTTWQVNVVADYCQIRSLLIDTALFFG